MGAYATPDQLKDRLSPRNKQTDGQSAAQLTDPELAEAIERAQSEVDARLAGRYFVPFDGIPPGAGVAQTVPALVVDIVLDIAAWHATLDYRRGTPVTADDPSRLRANAAETLLGQIAAGQSVLIGAAGSTPVASTDVSDPYVVNQPWHGCDLTDPRQLRPVPSASWPAGF